MRLSPTERMERDITRHKKLTSAIYTYALKNPDKFNSIEDIQYNSYIQNNNLVDIHKHLLDLFAYTPTYRTLTYTLQYDNNYQQSIPCYISRVLRALYQTNHLKYNQ